MTSRNLFLYWDMTANAPQWAANPADYQERFGDVARVIRVCSEGYSAPDGYTKTGSLANDKATKGTPRQASVRRGSANVRRGSANFYAIGVAILAASIEGLD